MAQPECAPWLVEFARDVYPEVRIHAIAGLAKLGTKDTLESLALALRGANDDWRRRYLESLRDDAGLLGLVVALQCFNDGTAAASGHVEQVFELIDSHAATPRRSMLDARGADAMADYMERAPSPGWRFRAATVLAIMGDLRAVPALAERIANKTPLTRGGLMPQEPSIEQDDEERATAARLIADLSDLHTESQAESERRRSRPCSAGCSSRPAFTPMPCAHSSKWIRSEASSGCTEGPRRQPSCPQFTIVRPWTNAG